MEIHSTEALKQALEKAQGYCVTVHLLNAENNDITKDKLVHYLLLNNFPLLDLLKCHKKAKELMISELEKDAELPEF